MAPVEVGNTWSLAQLISGSCQADWSSTESEILQLLHNVLYLMVLFWMIPIHTTRFRRSSSQSLRGRAILQCVSFFGLSQCACKATNLKCQQKVGCYDCLNKKYIFLLRLQKKKHLPVGIELMHTATMTKRLNAADPTSLNLSMRFFVTGHWSVYSLVSLKMIQCGGWWNWNLRLHLLNSTKWQWSKLPTSLAQRCAWWCRSTRA